MAIFCGIDYSLSCPAACYYDDSKPFSIDNVWFYYICKDSMEFPNATHVPYPKYTHAIDRYCLLAEKLLIPLKVELFFIEDYSFGSVGKVFTIAENVGILKYYIHKSRSSSYEMLAPTAVKKRTTGKGNANKEKMYEAFVDETGLLFSDKHIGKSPLADLIDSYYILKLGLNP